MAYSLELSYQYTNSTTKAEQTTDSVAVTYARQVTAAPPWQTTATMVLQIGKVPETMYEPPATRWYQEQISGSVRDLSNGWWKREEKTKVTVAGGLATSLNITARFQKHD